MATDLPPPEVIVLDGKAPYSVQSPWAPDRVVPVVREAMSEVGKPKEDRDGHPTASFRLGLSRIRLVARAEARGDGCLLTVDVVGGGRDLMGTRERRGAQSLLDYVATRVPLHALEGERQPQRQSSREALEAKWPSTAFAGAKPNSRTMGAVERMCLGRGDPWLVLTSSGAGSLAAWDDMLAIIKTGLVTGLMSGAALGGREATFDYSDITGIEYNAGLMNGVLEVLTPSYQGTVQHDFWRGTNKGRNEDSGDPYTLSNCLPLPKPLYHQVYPQIEQLRRMISEAKRPVVNVQLDASNAEPASSTLSAELRELAALHADGVLDASEFAEAKARLIRERG